MNKVAVVILNWNGSEMLRKFLPSVISYSALSGVDVYVADNGSTDNSLAVLNDEFPSVKQVVLKENNGFADGYNKALAQIEAEYYVLLNSDVEVTEHWLEPMIDYLDAHPEVAACQPKILSWRQKDIILDILSAGDVSWAWLKRIMVNIMILFPCSGLPEHRYLSARPIIGMLEDLMDASLLTWKRLIFAGG
ncbi:MAG: glycosyltransferase family 2 protein [Bacteroidetes bacterium]|nr:glycosyltransferase family 2 protein [Bacteroidota bacterium]